MIVEVIKEMHRNTYFIVNLEKWKHSKGQDDKEAIQSKEEAETVARCFARNVS